MKAVRGLGLAIAKSIVEQHGGKIWAECQPGDGLKISFTLPSERLQQIESSDKK